MCESFPSVFLWSGIQSCQSKKAPEFLEADKKRTQKHFTDHLSGFNGEIIGKQLPSYTSSRHRNDIMIHLEMSFRKPVWCMTHIHLSFGSALAFTNSWENSLFFGSLMLHYVCLVLGACHLEISACCSQNNTMTPMKETPNSKGTPENQNS